MPRARRFAGGPQCGRRKTVLATSAWDCAMITQQRHRRWRLPRQANCRRSAAAGRHSARDRATRTCRVPRRFCHSADDRSDTSPNCKARSRHIKYPDGLLAFHIYTRPAKAMSTSTARALKISKWATQHFSCVVHRDANRSRRASRKIQ